MSFGHRVVAILWPAFLSAAALEGLVFAVIEPASLHWFGGPAVEWSPISIYSVTFLILWGGVATASAMTALLSREEGEPRSP